MALTWAHTVLVETAAAGMLGLVLSGCVGGAGHDVHHTSSDRSLCEPFVQVRTQRDCEDAVGKTIQLDGVAIEPYKGASHIQALSRGTRVYLGLPVGIEKPPPAASQTDAARVFLRLPYGFAGLHVRVLGRLHKEGDASMKGVQTYGGVTYHLPDDYLIAPHETRDGFVVGEMLCPEKRVMKRYGDDVASSDADFPGRELLVGRRVVVEGVAENLTDLPILRVEYTYLTAWRLQLPKWSADVVGQRVVVTGVVVRKAAPSSQETAGRRTLESLLRAQGDFEVSDCKWELVD